MVGELCNVRTCFVSDASSKILLVHAIDADDQNVLDRTLLAVRQ
jgi:hypothetical protein